MRFVKVLNGSANDFGCWDVSLLRFSEIPSITFIDDFFIFNLNCLNNPASECQGS